MQFFPWNLDWNTPCSTWLWSLSWSHLSKSFEDSSRIKLLTRSNRECLHLLSNFMNSDAIIRTPLSFYIFILLFAIIRRSLTFSISWNLNVRSSVSNQHDEVVKYCFRTNYLILFSHQSSCLHFFATHSFHVVFSWNLVFCNPVPLMTNYEMMFLN